MATRAPKKLLSENALLMEEWDWEKNNELGLEPSRLIVGSVKRAWWICADCGHEWSAPIRHRAERRHKCPECAMKQRVASRLQNLLQKNGSITDKLLLREWNYEKNNDLKPDDFTPASNKAVWWKCSTCNFEWKAQISNRHIGRGCPCCSNKVTVPGKNDLKTVAPQLAKEWHPTKNLPLTCEDVTIGSGKKVWWLCQNNHEYQASVLHRGHGTNCPYCISGRQTSFGEQAVYYYVKQIFPDAINRAKKILTNKMELDIYIPSIKFAIEYDGLFWHRNEKKRKKGLREIQEMPRERNSSNPHPRGKERSVISSCEAIGKRRRIFPS